MIRSTALAESMFEPAAEGPGLLASGYFWIGGLLSGEAWAVLALWAIGLS